MFNSENSRRTNDVEFFLSPLNVGEIDVVIAQVPSNWLATFYNLSNDIDQMSEWPSVTLSQSVHFFLSFFSFLFESNGDRGDGGGGCRLLTIHLK